MASDHKFKIAGVLWLWRYTRLRGRAAGWAYLPDPGKPTKGTRKVLIDQTLKGRTRLETEIHEAIHCAFPQMSEESVTMAGADIARILWALGYRLTEE